MLSTKELERFDKKTLFDALIWFIDEYKEETEDGEDRAIEILLNRCQWNAADIELIGFDKSDIEKMQKGIE